MTAKVVFAWELGGYRGHLEKISPLALALRELGCEISVITRDLLAAYTLLGDYDIRLYQSPVMHVDKTLVRQVGARSMPEILQTQGYANEQSLEALLVAWESLFDAINPDLLIADYAPTALLAARHLQIPKVQIGTGFCMPCPGWPPENLAFWREEVSSIGNAESAVSSVVNSAMTKRGQAPMAYTSDIFSSDRSYIFSPPSFDLQKKLREDSRSRYVIMTAPGIAAGKVDRSWPSSERRKIFAYLKYGVSSAKVVADILRASDANVFCYLSGADEALCDTWSHENIEFSSVPYNLTDIVSGVDLVISHGGMGVMSFAVFHGVPQLVIPTQLEQAHNAVHLERLGAGDWVRKGEAPAKINEKFSVLYVTISINYALKAPANSIDVMR